MTLNTVNCYIYSPDLANIFANKISLKKEEKEEIISYDYQDISISELAVLAKSDQDAKNALAKTCLEEINTHAKTFIKGKSYYEFSEIKSKLYFTFLRAIEIYDINHGKFMNLFRRMAVRALRFYHKEKALSHARQVKYFGQKINNFEKIYFLNDSHLINDSTSDKIKYRVELDKYLSKRTDEEKAIIKLYQCGMTFAEISNLLKIPLSKVAYKFYMMLKPLKSCFI